MATIVNNPNYPVQFLFAGKAHPADGAGQGLIKKIYEISRRPEFLGKIIFLENYDMKLARRLVTGVDIWMNTPTRPLEASGTSGEKALMNGVVNLSVLDGWWLEGYREGAGWALTDKRTFQNQEQQDQLDAATNYYLLENEILPLYYNQSEKGYSEGWIKTVKNSIAQVAPHYTMKRQLDDYYTRFYEPLAARRKELYADKFKKAKEIAAWKELVASRWDKINVVSYEKEEDIINGDVLSGKKYKTRNTSTVSNRSRLSSVRATSTHSRLHTASLQQEPSWLHTVCSRRMQNCHTVRTSATLSGSINLATQLKPLYIFMEPVHFLWCMGSFFMKKILK